MGLLKKQPDFFFRKTTEFLDRGTWWVSSIWTLARHLTQCDPSIPSSIGQDGDWSLNCTACKELVRRRWRAFVSKGKWNSREVANRVPTSTRLKEMHLSHKYRIEIEEIMEWWRHFALHWAKLWEQCAGTGTGNSSIKWNTHQKAGCSRQEGFFETVIKVFKILRQNKLEWCKVKPVYRTGCSWKDNSGGDTAQGARMTGPSFYGSKCLSIAKDWARSPRGPFHSCVQI